MTSGNLIGNPQRKSYAAGRLATDHANICGEYEMQKQLPRAASESKEIDYGGEVHERQISRFISLQSKPTSVCSLHSDDPNEKMETYFQQSRFVMDEARCDFVIPSVNEGPNMSGHSLWSNRSFTNDLVGELDGLRLTNLQLSRKI